MVRVLVMREVKYINSFGDETIVQECSRRECLDIVDDFVRDYRDGYYCDYMSAYIEYEDGSYFYLFDGDWSGVYRKQHIKGIIIDYYSKWLVYGPYRMDDDNVMPELI